MVLAGSDYVNIKTALDSNDKILPLAGLERTTSKSEGSLEAHFFFICVWNRCNIIFISLFCDPHGMYFYKTALSFLSVFLHMPFPFLIAHKFCI